jgi:hypothetical protein
MQPRTLVPGSTPTAARRCPFNELETDLLQGEAKERPITASRFAMRTYAYPVERLKLFDLTYWDGPINHRKQLVARPCCLDELY